MTVINFSQTATSASGQDGSHGPVDGVEIRTVVVRVPLLIEQSNGNGEARFCR